MQPFSFLKDFLQNVFSEFYLHSLSLFYRRSFIFITTKEKVLRVIHINQQPLLWLDTFLLQSSDPTDRDSKIR